MKSSAFFRTFEPSPGHNKTAYANTSMQTNVLSAFNVQVRGKGSQPMLFAHGLGCDQNMWRFLTPAFEDNYRLVLFDYIGSGKSDLALYDKEKYSSLHGYAEDVVAICRELDLKEVIFVGHSVSAMIGVLAANQAPEFFASLVLVSPSPCYINGKEYKGGFEKREIEQLLSVMQQNMGNWARLYAPKIMGNAAQTALSEELRESFCAADPDITHRFATVTFTSDNRSDLQEVKLPSLILQCAEDILAPVEVGAYMAARMPRSTLKLLTARGHCPHVSAPAETIAAIKEYLSNAGGKKE